MQIECHAELVGAKAAEWQDFLDGSPHQHPRQDLRFGSVERAAGLNILHVIGRVNGGVRAVGLFSLHPHPLLRSAHSEAFCLSGPVCDDAETLASFLQAAARDPAFSRVGRIRATPYWFGGDAERLHGALASRGWESSETWAARQTGWIDLRRAPDAILASFSKSARREFRRAERQGVVIRRVDALDDAMTFLESLNRLRRERGLALLARAPFIESFDAVYREGDAGAILGAWQGETFLGGLLLYRGRFTAHGRHFTTEPAALRTLANLRISPSLWLEGMIWAQSLGCENLDVEGYEAPSEASGNKYNIYKYKSELGPKLIQRIPESSFINNTLINLTGNYRKVIRSNLKKVVEAGRSKKRAHAT